MIPDDPYYQSFVNSSAQVHGVQGGIWSELTALADGATPGGGHYQVDLEQLKTIHRKWSDLQTTLQSALENIQMGEANTVSQHPYAPGNEQASQHVSTAISTSKDAYIQYLTGSLQYVGVYVDNLQKAIQGYSGTEESVAAAARTIQSEQA
jgi:hypothetical protein